MKHYTTYPGKGILQGFCKMETNTHEDFGSVLTNVAALLQYSLLKSR